MKIDENKIRISEEMLGHYKHVDHARYHVLFEDAQREFLKKRNVGFEEIKSSYGMRCVQRFCSIEYIRPLRSNDDSIIRTTLDTNGNTSFTFVQHIGVGDVITTSCKTVYVLVGNDDNKVFMPLEIKKKLTT